MISGSSYFGEIVKLITLNLFQAWGIILVHKWMENSIGQQRWEVNVLKYGWLVYVSVSTAGNETVKSLDLLMLVLLMGCGYALQGYIWQYLDLDIWNILFRICYSNKWIWEVWEYMVNIWLVCWSYRWKRCICGLQIRESL